MKTGPEILFLIEKWEGDIIVMGVWGKAHAKTFRATPLYRQERPFMNKETSICSSGKPFNGLSILKSELLYYGWFVQTKFSFK